VSDSRSDDVLLRAWIDGDEGAFEEIYRRYQWYVTKVASEHSRRGDLEDVSQIAWMRICRYAKTKPETMPLPVYVRLSAAWAASEFYRRPRTSEPTTNLSEEKWEELERKLGASGTTISDFFAPNGIAGLRERESRILTACFLEGRDSGEVARELGISHQRLSQLRKRAIRKLFDATPTEQLPIRNRWSRKKVLR